MQSVGFTKTYTTVGPYKTPSRYCENLMRIIAGHEVSKGLKKVSSCFVSFGHSTNPLIRFVVNIERKGFWCHGSLCLN